MLYNNNFCNNVKSFLSTGHEQHIHDNYVNVALKENKTKSAHLKLSAKLQSAKEKLQNEKNKKIKKKNNKVNIKNTNNNSSNKEIQLASLEVIANGDDNHRFAWLD